MMKRSYSIALFTFKPSKLGPMIIKRNFHSSPCLFMWKATRMVNLQPEDKEVIAKATLKCVRTISQPKDLKALANQNLVPFLKSNMEYIMANNDGLTPQIKINLLSGMFSKTMIPFHEVKNSFKDICPNSKLDFKCVPKTTTVPIRTLVEVPIAHNFAERYSIYIHKIELTGDAIIPVLSGKGSRSDIYMECYYKNQIKPIYADVKGGNNMTASPMGGTIGQVTYQGNKQIIVPNNIVDLERYNVMARKKEIKILRHSVNNINLPQDQQQTFDHCVYQIMILNNSFVRNPITNHTKIEDLLMQINCLPNIRGRPDLIPSFITIVQSGRVNPLTLQEQLYIKAILPHINENIFITQGQFDIYIIKVLKIYVQHFDKEPIEELKLLKGTIWEPSFLDYIDTDILN